MLSSLCPLAGTISFQSCPFSVRDSKKFKVMVTRKIFGPSYSLSRVDEIEGVRVSDTLCQPFNYSSKDPCQTCV